MPAPRRAVLCTIAVGPHAELFEIGRPTFERFAATHGYDLVVSDQNLAPGRPPSWGKVPLLRSLLTAYDLAVWVDADALFVDTTRDIAADLLPGRCLHVVAHRYAGQRIANFGVMVVARARWTERFLDAVWDTHELIEHQWWENAAALRLLGYSLDPVRLRRPTLARLRTGYLDRQWNSIPQDPSPRPRITHYPGIDLADRRRRMLDDVAALPSG